MQADTNNEMQLRSPEDERSPAGDSKDCVPHHLVAILPAKTLVPKSFLEYRERICNFKFESDDILVMTFPKSGTHWVAEILWTILQNRNFDNPEAQLSIFERTTFIEGDIFLTGEDYVDGSPKFELFKKHCPGKNPRDGIHLQISESAKRPRLLKTHLPFSLLGNNILKTCKVIYLMRNPKDVVVSFRHHSHLLESEFLGNPDEIVQKFIEDKLVFGPYWNHVREAWALRTHPNVLFLLYNELKRNTKEQMHKISEFLHADLQSSEIDKLVEYTSFPQMKSREKKWEEIKPFPGCKLDFQVLKAEGGFFRNGEPNAWKGKLTQDQETKIDAWIEKNAPEMQILLK